MSAESQEVVSETSIETNSILPTSNSRSTPRDQFTSSERAFEAPSTGKSSIGSASMTFQVGGGAVADIIRGRVIPTLTKKTRETAVLRQYPTRNRTPDKDDDVVNPYEGKNFEFINELLHNIYPVNNKGVIVRDHFNVLKANTDIANLKDLKKGAVEYDETLIFTDMWVDKIKAAVKAETDDFEAFI